MSNLGLEILGFWVKDDGIMFRECNSEEKWMGNDLEGLIWHKIILKLKNF